jgi:DNA-binding transcriptional ArsR family regulator
VKIEDEPTLDVGLHVTTEEIIFSVSDVAVLHALSDPIRLKILALIASAQRQEMCACDLVVPTDKSQPTISHHLKVLVESGLLTSKRQGRWMIYSISNDALSSLLKKLGKLIPSKGQT